jgi:hypothetical protein
MSNRTVAGTDGTIGCPKESSDSPSELRSGIPQSETEGTNIRGKKARTRTERGIGLEDGKVRFGGGEDGFGWGIELKRGKIGFGKVWKCVGEEITERVGRFYMVYSIGTGDRESVRRKPSEADGFCFSE